MTTNVVAVTEMKSLFPLHTDIYISALEFLFFLFFFFLQMYTCLSSL